MLLIATCHLNSTIATTLGFFIKKNVDFCLKSMSVDEIAIELQELIAVYRNKLKYAEKL